MTFTPKTWQDSPSTSTPISAAALIDLETRVTGYSDTITATAQTGATYTFALTDLNTCVEGNRSTGQTFTIPPHSSVAFPVGAIIEVFQLGAGQVTIAAGVGVTLRSDSAKVNIAAQYGTIGLRQRATDEWVLSGDLA